MPTVRLARRSLLLAGSGLALAPTLARAATPELGQPAPAFSAVDSTGKTWSLADLKGKVVVIGRSEERRVGKEC